MKLNNKKTLGFTLVFLLAIIVICFFMMDWTKNNSSEQIHLNPDIDSLEIKEDTVGVETFFNNVNDNEEKIINLKIDLLKEIGFCDSKKCPTDLFRILPLNSTDSLSNAFFLIVKAGVNNSPTRKIYVFKRINNELALLNLFNGNLIQLIRNLKVK